MEDPRDTSVSTLDINASSGYSPARAPGEWSRSTNSSHEYGYKQDSQDTASGVESLANFSIISLSDSIHYLESVEISLESSEEREIRRGTRLMKICFARCTLTFHKAESLEWKSLLPSFPSLQNYTFQTEVKPGRLLHRNPQ